MSSEGFLTDSKSTCLQDLDITTHFTLIASKLILIHPIMACDDHMGKIINPDSAKAERVADDPSIWSFYGLHEKYWVLVNDSAV